MFSRILVPTDFSSPSDAAMEYARQLAAKFGASLHLLHVIDDSPVGTTAFVADSYVPPTEGLSELMLKEARKRLERQLSDADRLRFGVSVEALIGVPATAIVDYAFATGTNLIVMGTHGRSGLAHLLMGSVAEHVVRTATCPVLTVRQVTAPAEATANAQVSMMPQFLSESMAI